MNAIATASTPAALHLSRHFNATPEKLFEAWTDPRKLKAWWGPRDFTCPSARSELRIGGNYLYCIRDTEGHDFWSTGTYRELDAPRRLVFTDSFSDAEGRIVPASHYGMGGVWPLELVVTVTLEREDIGTRFNLQHEGLPPGPDTEMCAASWRESFQKLAAFLAQE